MLKLLFKIIVDITKKDVQSTGVKEMIRNDPTTNVGTRQKASPHCGK